jgi:hypothetical protein
MTVFADDSKDFVAGESAIELIIFRNQSSCRVRLHCVCKGGAVRCCQCSCTALLNEGNVRLDESMFRSSLRTAILSLEA